MADKVVFKLPDGFVPPEGKPQGATVETMCLLRLEDNGSACLVRVGNVDMPGYKSEEKPDTMNQKSEFIDAYQKAMGGQSEDGAPLQT